MSGFCCFASPRRRPAAADAAAAAGAAADRDGETLKSLNAAKRLGRVGGRMGGGVSL